MMAAILNKALMLAIVERKPDLFRFAPLSLQGDREVVLTVLSENYPDMIQYVAEPLKTELEFTLAEHSEKGVSEYVAVMQTLRTRNQAEWNALQQAPCSEGVGLAHRYRNVICDGKDDSTTWEAIQEGHGVCLDAKCYDSTMLQRWLQKKHRLPHNKAAMQPNFVEWLMTRPEPWPATTPPAEHEQHKKRRLT